MTDPVVTNSADPAQVTESLREDKSERERINDDLRFVLESRHGRRLLWRYLSVAGVFRSSFSVDPYATAFNEGKRVIGNTLMSDITDARADALIQMMTEARAEAEERQRAAESRAQNQTDPVS